MVKELLRSEQYKKEYKFTLVQDALCVLRYLVLRKKTSEMDVFNKFKISRERARQILQGFKWCGMATSEKKGRCRFYCFNEKGYKNFFAVTKEEKEERKVRTRPRH